MDLSNKKGCTVSARQGVSVVKGCLVSLYDRANLQEGGLTKIFGQKLVGRNTRDPENKYQGVLEAFSVRITNVLARQGNIKEDFRFVARVILELEKSAQEFGICDLLSSDAGVLRVVIAPNDEIVPERFALPECSSDDYDAFMSMRRGNTRAAMDLIFRP